MKIIGLVVAAALCAPASAAANQWYVETGVGGHGARQRLAPGQEVTVPTEGSVKLKVSLKGQHGKTKVTCAVKGAELLRNATVEEATVQTIEQTFTGCSGGVIVTAVMLPWMGVLAGDCQPCVISRPEALELTLAGVNYGVFTGVVTGTIGDFDAPIKDDIDWHYTFKDGGRFAGAPLTNESGLIQVGGAEVFGTKAQGNRADGEPNGAPVIEEEGKGQAIARAANHGRDPDGDEG